MAKPRQQLLVPFVGPTFIDGRTMRFYMGDAVMRHPNFHLLPLPRIGAVSVESSAKCYGRHVLEVVGPGLPYVAAGQSQGGIVAALRGLKDPYAEHIVMLNAPLNGAWLSWLLVAFPSARQLLPGSRFLHELRESILDQPNRFTSISCPDEEVMDSGSPFIPGIHHILVGSLKQVNEFRRDRPGLHIDEVVTSKHHVTHTNAMRSPEFRGALWRIVTQQARQLNMKFA